MLREAMVLIVDKTVSDNGVVLFMRRFGTVFVIYSETRGIMLCYEVVVWFWRVYEIVFFLFFVAKL